MDYNIRDGRTYMYFKGEPLYAFGHGLSYTTFNYENLQINKETLKKGEVATVSIEVKNTGNRDGEEVVQLYVTHKNSAVERPIQALKGFHRTALKAGETKTVEIPLKASDLKYWNTEKHEFQLENDQLVVKIGGASDAIKLTKSLIIQN